VEHFAEALRWVGTAEAPRRGEELDVIAAGVRSRVRRELPVAYAEGGDLRKERSFFAPLAAGRLLRQRLGTELLARGRYEEAKQVFSWLSLDAPGSCVDRAQLARAEAANGWGDRRATVGRFEDAVAAYRRFALGDATPRAKRQCGRALLRGLLGTAMQWHLRSMGGSVDDREGMMEGALALYRHAAREFTGREMERLHVAPGLPYVEFAAADLLFYLKRWDECGVAFGDIVADDPRGGLASEAARASSICFLHAAGESSPKGEEEAATYVPRALTDGERARLVAWNRHACWFAKDAEDSSFRGQYGDVLFARARVYEATGRWHIAARAYREMVEALPEHAHAAEAAAGYAGALHALGAKVQPKKMACIQELAEEVPDLVDRVCAKGSANRDGRSCRILREADCDLIGFQLSRESADMDDERGAERFLAYFDEHRGECTGSTGALLVAATFLEHQGRHARAIRVLKRLRDPANGLADSREAQLASLQIARNLAALGFFERAAEEYERFAAEGPELVGHGDALRDAGRLRLGLGQLEAALVDRATLAARGPSPALAQLDLALAKRHAADESWASVLGALDQGTLAALDGNVARRFEADALRARALAELGQGELARGAHDAIVARWEEPATVEAFMAAPSKEQRAILQSVSASLLWRADEERARATSASLAGREAAIERAAEAYDRVAELMPVPVPADTVSAAAATAEMWGGYAAALRAGDPHRARAVRRAVKLALACIDRSSAFQHVGAASRCETLLAKLAPSRYGATVAPRAMPLLLPGISARAVPLRRRRA
jgi:tetratricopeptide (TPR) repeat protein